MLVVTCPRVASVPVGALGKFSLEPGFYLYVGSAFGPGGLRGRVSRHLRNTATRRWHIDFLLESCHAERVWYQTQERSREHDWARVLVDVPGVRAAVTGFGSSDCRCSTHLFFSEQTPSVASFRRVLRSSSLPTAKVVEESC